MRRGPRAHSPGNPPQCPVLSDAEVHPGGHGGRRPAHHETYRRLAEAVAEAAPSCRHILERIDEHLGATQYYQALKTGRTLRTHERELLQHVS